MPTAFLVLALEALSRDEAALREAFEPEIRSEEASRRVAAVRTLAGAREEKTLELLARSLKDPSGDVRKAAAETIKALGEVLVDRKVAQDLRLACAKALSKSPYKAEPFRYYYEVISTIQPEEKELHVFGYQVTKILEGFIGKSFGAQKSTAERWNDWWTDNKDALLKEDEKKREEYRKARQN